MDHSSPSNRPASVKQAGLIVTIVGGLMVFSNGSGALMHTMMNADTTFAPPPEGSPTLGLTVDEAFNNYLTLCLTMVLVGAMYFVGGVFIRRYKKWANRLVTILTAVLILGIWWMSIGFSSSMQLDPVVKPLSFFPYIVAVVISVPFGLLIRFLNRRTILDHFE